jgi:hypothetical protein
MAVSVAPRSRPTRISSRSSSESRPGDGLHPSGWADAFASQRVRHGVTRGAKHPADLAPFVSLRREAPELALDFGSILFIHASS